MTKQALQAILEERMNEGRLSKQIYEASVFEQVSKGRQRRTHNEQIFPTSGRPWRPLRLLVRLASALEDDCYRQSSK